MAFCTVQLTSVCAALEVYEVGVREVVHDWHAKIETFEGRPINTTLYSTLIPLDALGKVAFSKDLGCVTAGSDHGIQELAEAFFKVVAVTAHADWPLAIYKDLLPKEKHVRFEKLTVDLIDEREKVCC